NLHPDERRRARLWRTPGHRARAGVSQALLQGKVSGPERGGAPRNGLVKGSSGFTLPVRRCLGARLRTAWNLTQRAPRPQRVQDAYRQGLGRGVSPRAQLDFFVRLRSLGALGVRFSGNAFLALSRCRLEVCFQLSALK